MGRLLNTTNLISVLLIFQVFLWTCKLGGLYAQMDRLEALLRQSRLSSRFDNFFFLQRYKKCVCVREERENIHICVCFILTIQINKKTFYQYQNLS